MSEGKRPVVEWTEASSDYIDLIKSEEWDSRYLRERGLIPNVLDLFGRCDGDTVLDAGTGTGWLFEYIRPKNAHALDLVKPEDIPTHVDFRQGDVCSMDYEDNFFDTIVASLLLMFCQDFRKILREFHRVSKYGGCLVVSLVHPYFYRTGSVTPDGWFRLERSLSKETAFELRIGDAVGPFTYYYRPFPEYLNAFVESGWQIAETRDWFIDIEDYSQIMKTGVKSNLIRSGAIPLYSFIRATKGN